MRTAAKESGLPGLQVLPHRNLHHSILCKMASSSMLVLHTSRRMDADLGKSALMRTARLKNSLGKGLKRMVTKVQWLC